TNITSTSFLAESPEWYCYDLPGEAVKKAFKGRFRGQRQKWFALRFEGSESEIDIDSPAGGHKPEFDAWRWEEAGRLAHLIVPFKRPVYEKVVGTFGHLASPR
ncbi:MAG TPA: RNA pyrophosphohydrolase, partial [Methylocella sp.]|nr:RNA pyrophosphohydrolase [Methylocella sp.]